MTKLRVTATCPLATACSITIRLIMAALLSGTAGCAGQDVTKTGFLTNYDQMKSTADHEDDLIYVNPGLKTANYRAVIIDPVVWHPVADGPQLSPEIATRMETAFHDSLVKEFGPQLQVVDGSSCGKCAGILRVRAAITNVRRSKWYFNIIPVTLDLGATAAGGFLPPIPPPAPGGASEELAAVDAATGETMVTIATYNNGMPWNPTGQILPYRHAQRAFTLASKLLVEQVAAGVAPMAGGRSSVPDGK
jgi:hypothetical protein